MEKLGVTSKLNTDLDFLLYLKEIGRRTAGRWLDRNFAALNERSSLDIKKVFLSGVGV
jgi:NTE family protein